MSLREKINSLDQFTRGYIEAMLWSESNPDSDSDKSFQDLGFDVYNLSHQALDKCIADCTQFQRDNAELLERYDYLYPGYSSLACAGHDFWFSRKHAGVGFWDRGLGELGDQLHAAAQKFDESTYPYLCGGKIHIE